MPLNAGRLNRRIKIMKRVDGQDGAGQPTTSLTQFCETWADIKAPSGISEAEGVKAGAQTSPAHYSMRIRWRTGVTIDMEVHEVVAGTTVVYKIAKVIPDYASREHVDLVCIAGVA